MKFRTYLLLSFLILITACSKPEVKVPADIIPRDSMIVVLADIHLIEATIQLKGLGRNDTLKAEAYGRYRYVFNKHKISSTQFRKSLEYYRSEPEYFHTMYNEVITRLSVEQAKSNKP